MVTKKTRKKLKSKRAKKPSSKKLAKVKKYFHRECHLCLSNIEDGPEHVCVPLTERDLIKDLPEDFREAFLELRRFAAGLGDQKIYNNARAVMFSKKVCYMFVRPKKTFLELCFFLPRKETHRAVLRAVPTSKTKFSHTVKLVHPDQIESPLTTWLRESFEASA
jgi:hypothetical protein